MRGTAKKTNEYCRSTGNFRPRRKSVSGRFLFQRKIAKNDVFGPSALTCDRRNPINRQKAMDRMTLMKRCPKEKTSRSAGKASPRTRFIRPFTVWLMLVVLGMMWGCGSKRPVLYPNYQLTQVGQEAAEADIDHCMALARTYGADTQAGAEVAKDTATGAAVGGATGAAVGAVLGGVGKGAAAGAAGGAAGALTRGVIRSGDPDPTFRRFVEKCLRDKGYEPVGWH
jgi:outer membrane lipoprotein SlyB